MVSKKQYATWALKLAEGEDHFVDELYDALIEDGYVDYRNNLVIYDEELLDNDE